MDTPDWAQLLIDAFPNLSSEDFEIVDEPSDLYNCIAYAVGDIAKPWDPNGTRYWPPWAPRNDRIDSLIAVFAGLEPAYEQCESSQVEDGYQKVALYEVQGQAKHAALQMPNGRWRSKMGRGPVIEHRSPESLSDGIYGDVHCFMRRPQLQGE